jgi:hypothetical protein
MLSCGHLCGCHLQLIVGQNSDMGEIYMMNYIANHWQLRGEQPPVADIVLYTW